MSVCGLVHAAVMKTGKLYVAEAEEAEFLRRARRFALQCAPLQTLTPVFLVVCRPVLLHPVICLGQAPPPQLHEVANHHRKGPAVHGVYLNF